MHRPLLRPVGVMLRVAACFTFLMGSTGSIAFAGEAGSETAYIFNSLLFLIGGFLVMFMAAGFAMLEAGMVRSRSVSTILTKNIALYSLAGLMYYLLGYNLMYSGVDGGYFGSFGIWAADDSAALAGDFSGNYAASSDWFFQMVFVATAASVVSGAMAERVKLWPFLFFTAVLTGLFYPVTGAWKWGTGWLDVMGFQDFAGSTLVHSVGGWAALAGLLLLGPRKGRYGADGRPQPMPGSSMPLVTLGTFILWFGWFGFNGASQLAMGSAADVIAIANVFANTNIAAAAGVLAAMCFCQLRYKKVDITLTLNGALGGLVSITAEPLAPTLGQAALIGAAGAVLVCLCVPLLDKLKIDDVVGALPVHLVCGIWGTLAVPLTNTDASFGTQAVGVLAIGAFTFLASYVLWLLLKVTVGIRLSPEEEHRGSDHSEIGIEAYPEFVRG